MRGGDGSRRPAELHSRVTEATSPLSTTLQTPQSLGRNQVPAVKLNPARTPQETSGRRLVLDTAPSQAKPKEKQTPQPLGSSHSAPGHSATQSQRQHLVLSWLWRPGWRKPGLFARPAPGAWACSGPEEHAAAAVPSIAAWQVGGGLPELLDPQDSLPSTPKKGLGPCKGWPHRLQPGALRQDGQQQAPATLEYGFSCAEPDSKTT